MVNHDGGLGTAPDPLVWSAGALPKRRRLVHAVRDRAFLPGPLGLWDSDCVNIPASAICAADVALWPYTPGLLVKWVTFLEILELVASLMWNFLSSMSFGQERGSHWKKLLLVTLGQGVQFQCRLFLLVQALIFGAHAASLEL